MPSFDIVSEVNKHELINAVDQANREVQNRFDFKGTNSRFELKEDEILLVAPTDFQLKQLNDILQTKVAKRNIDVNALQFKDPVVQLHEARQEAKVRNGIDAENAKKIVKIIKDQKFKVQAAIQGEQIRVTGKKRDDLQEVIAYLRQQKLGLPLQFTNFRE